MFNNVLWVTDGSTDADRALPFAKRVAERDGATLHVAHVAEYLSGPRLAGLPARVDQPEIEAQVRRQADAARDEGLTVQLHMAAAWNTTEVAHRIAEIAAGCDADLIVMGSHGRSPVANTIIGSVTQRVLHVAGRPVLVVPPLRAAVVGADAGRGQTPVT